MEKKLFARVGHHLPPLGAINSHDKNRNIMQYVGCNPMFRIAKYQPGGQFEIHMDGVNEDDHENTSVLTLNIFLNDDFDGGETDFLHNKRLRCSVLPEVGKAALFDHGQYHRGNKVSNGEKYLLRTDIMVKTKNKNK